MFSVGLVGKPSADESTNAVYTEKEREEKEGRINGAGCLAGILKANGVKKRDLKK